MGELSWVRTSQPGKVLRDSPSNNKTSAHARQAGRGHKRGTITAQSLLTKLLLMPGKLAGGIIEEQFLPKVDRQIKRDCLDYSHSAQRFRTFKSPASCQRIGGQFDVGDLPPTAVAQKRVGKLMSDDVVGKSN